MNFTTGKEYQERYEMLTLFNNYKNSGSITEAVLIGRNMFNRNPANQEVFAPYYDFLCSLAESLPSIDDRRDFAGQASIALAFFSENAKLNSSVIADIAAYQQRLGNIFSLIESIEQTQADVSLKEIETLNDACLKRVYKLKDSLRGTSTQESFDRILSEIGVVDSEINKEALKKEQRKIYDTLTKECTDLISSKIRELEHKKNVVYNKQAVDSFAKAFKQFRNDEGKYKNQTQIFSLVSATLFAYDVSRLFNETLIYYNHVYSYIFSKLDDDGKLALTRYSIECERKLR